VEVLARAAVAVVAVVAIGWLGVLLRDELLARSANDRVFYTPTLSGPALARELDRLKSARLLNPDPKPELQRAALLLQRGHHEQAARIAEEQVRREPAGLDAWTIIAKANRQRDPARAAEALAEIKRRNPLAGQFRGAPAPAPGTDAPPPASRPR
jgi:hypothetical protein